MRMTTVCPKVPQCLARSLENFSRASLGFGCYKAGSRLLRDSMSRLYSNLGLGFKVWGLGFIGLRF